MKSVNGEQTIKGIIMTRIEPDIFRYEVPENTHFTLDDIRNLWEYGNACYPNGKRKVLGVFNSNFSFSKEALEFMASLKRSEKIAAEAFYINSSMLRLKTNFYLTVKKPVINSRVFDNEERAILWLRKQNNEDLTKEIKTPLQ